MSTLLLPLSGTDLIEPVASDARLVTAALLGIAVIVVLITWAKLHPFLALTLGGLTVGVVAGSTSPSRSRASRPVSAPPRPGSAP